MKNEGVSREQKNTEKIYVYKMTNHGDRLALECIEKKKTTTTTT